MVYKVKNTDYIFIEGEVVFNGGFNKIIECTLEDLNGNVIKNNLVLKRSINDSDLLQAWRLEREMRYIEMLEHDNILKPFYCDYNEGFIVMERYPMNLHDFIGEGNYSKEEYMKIFSDILNGVQYYLSQGIFHRDLKPKNILIDSQMNLKITDFGLSSRVDREETQQQLTKIGHVGGTEFFSAPEQLKNLQDSDVRSEIYSLGKILYVLATRDLTYHTVNPIASMNIQLRHIITTATKYDPNERYQTIEDFVKSFNIVYKNNNKMNIKAYKLESITSGISSELHKTNPSIEKYQTFMSVIINPDYDETVDLMVALDVGTHRAMWNLDPSSYIIFMQNACNEISKKGFIYDFIDNITSSAVSILEDLNKEIDIELQAQLINAIVEVSASHNRFWSMEKIGKYIMSIEDDFLIDNLIRGKYKLLDHRIEKIRNYYDSTNLHTIYEGVMEERESLF